MKLPFASQAYQHKAAPVSVQRCLNLYPEPTPEGEYVLLPTPGLAVLADTGTDEIKALHKLNGLYYLIAGSSLYSMTSQGTLAHLGDVGNDCVQIVDNGFELFIPGDTSFVYSVENGLEPVTDDGFLGASTATYQDGYIIVSVPDSSSFQISGLNDATDWTATDYASAEGSPDKLVRVISDHRELWLFGESTTEVFYNSGNADFPFERTTFIERGCGGKWTVQKDDNSVFWLGDDGVVYRANGYTPVRVSTHAIETEIKGYTSEPRSYLHEYEGHKFYILSYSEGTWAYDISVSRWTERGSYGLTRSRVNCICDDIAGDYANGKVYRFNGETYDEGGETLQRIAVTPFIGEWDTVSVLNKLTIQFEQGTGLPNDQGDDPQVMLDWTEDGKTWSHSLSRSIGALGEYNWQTIFHRLGTFRKRAFRLTISDPVNVVLIDAYAE
jgi:hypothetical protein